MSEIRLATVIFSVLTLPLFVFLGWKNADLAMLEAEATRRAEVTQSKNEAALSAALEANGGPLVYDSPFRKGRVKQGLLVGRHSGSGNLKFILPRAGGSRHGVEQHFHENGNLSLMATYVNGKRHGLYFEYQSDGTPIVEKSYVQGKTQGEVVHYYSGGEVHKRYRMIDGKKNGLAVFYRLDGSVITRLPFSDSDRNGTQVFYDRNGRITTTLPWVEGSRNGEQVFYNEDGTVTGREWIDGKSSRIYTKQM